MNYTAFWGLMLLLLLSLPFPACNKVDQHVNLLEGQPYLSGPALQTTYIVGDTITLQGKLFLDQSNTKITLGNVSVTIIGKSKIFSGITDGRTGKPDSLDVCRFIVTKDMVGVNLSLTVTANGYTIQGGLVTVVFINSGNRRTDTTLVVDKIGTWLPADVGRFQTHSTPLVNNCSVAGDGTVYFDNLDGIFRLAGGQVSPVLAPGNTLTDQAQHSFVIDAVISSTVSLDGTTLYFSSIDKENVAPAADTLYIVRLCTMNTQTQNVTTLNRTTVRKGLGTYMENPGPFNAPIATAKIVAHNLHTDINGNIFFTNYYFPENTGQNALSGYDPYNSTTQWYNPLKMADNVADLGGNGGTLTSICRLDNNGQVTSLAQTNLMAFALPPPYTTPGPVLSDATYDFLLSPDGNLVYGMKYDGGLLGSADFGLTQYDLTQQDIEHTYSPQGNFLFISFDTAAATKYASGPLGPPTVANAGEFYNYLILPNNDILLSPCDNHNVPGQVTASLYAYDMTDMTVYCYAGTEKQNTRVQKNETGNAKFVNFKGANLRFCGLNRQGSVYYCLGGYTDFGQSVSPDYVNGVKFYKLHRKGT